MSDDINNIDVNSGAAPEEPVEKKHSKRKDKKAAKKAAKAEKKAAKASGVVKEGAEDNWLKVIAIVVAVALVMSVIVSNFVSITAIKTMKSASNGTVVVPDGGSAPVGGGNTATTAAPVGGGSAPVGGNTATTAAPVGGNTATTAAPVGGNTATTAAPSGGDSDTPTPTEAPQAQGMTAEQVFNFYKDACIKIKNDGIAGHTRKEWQDVTRDVDVGSSFANGLVKPIISSFMKGEADAGESISEKGSDDAKNRMCPCDASFGTVESATYEEVNGNYKITIIMKTQKAMFSDVFKGADGVPLVSTGILYPEDVKDTVQNNDTVKAVVKSLGDDSFIEYQNYTIVAEMTKDGQFVSIDHSVLGDIYATADIKIVGGITGSGALTFHSKWYNFNY